MAIPPTPEMLRDGICHESAREREIRSTITFAQLFFYWNKQNLCPEMQIEDKVLADTLFRSSTDFTIYFTKNGHFFLYTHTVPIPRGGSLLSAHTCPDRDISSSAIVGGCTAYRVLESACPARLQLYTYTIITMHLQ